MDSIKIPTLNSLILQNASSNQATRLRRNVGPDMLAQTCWPRNVGPDMFSDILQYLFVSPLHVIPQLIKFLPRDRYVISLNSDTVNIGRHSLPLLFRVSLSIPLNNATLNLSKEMPSKDESMLHSRSRLSFLY